LKNPKPKIKPKRYTVSVRRFGVFKPLTRTRTQSKAFSLGETHVGRTLAATFKVKGKGLKLRTPKGFYSKRTKEGVLFIEKRGKRLSTRPETREIKTFKRKKTKKKKKGKKR